MPDHHLALSLIEPILPKSSATAPDSPPYWERIQTILLDTQGGTQSLKSRQGGQGKGDEVLILAALQLLTAIVRFQNGRYSRTVVENIPWSSKSVMRFSTMRKRATKDKKGKSAAAAATFSRPDIRLSFTGLILAVLHPAAVPDFDPDFRRSSDAGVGTSTKMALLSSDYALPHVASIFKTLNMDPTSVAVHVLHVFLRSVLWDSKMSRSTIIAFIGRVELSELLLQLGSQSPSLERLTSAMLEEICTKPDRGICFSDRGWYGRPISSTADQNSALNSGFGHEGDDSLDPEEAVDANPSNLVETGIYNPLLSHLVQSSTLSPLFNAQHRELLLAILTAAPELQPLYQNSARNAFASARLEPPQSGPGNGARLTFLLANRFLGQIIDIPLPRFEEEAPPASNKVLSALLPNVLVKAYLVKGLKHSDRLVRWSTLDLLGRLIAKLQKTIDVFEDSTRRETAWKQTLRIVLREAFKRLPDVSILLQSCNVDLAGSQSEGPPAGTPRHSSDWLMLDSALKVLFGFLRLGRHSCSPLGANASLTPADAKKLLNAPWMSVNDDGESDGAAASFQPLVHLHTLRTLQLVGPSFIISGGTAGTRSSLAQIVELSMNEEYSDAARLTARQLLSDAFGAGTSTSDIDGTVSDAAASLLFEGDSTEFEVWIAALDPGHAQQSQEARSHVIAILEECFSRCSKNAYRYLESARSASGDSDEHVLPVSPMLACLIEQVSIKLEKSLLASQSSRTTILEYLRRLLPLVASRGRPKCEQAITQYFQKLVQVVQEAGLGPAEQAIVCGTGDVMPSGSLRASVLVTNGGKETLAERSIPLELTSQGAPAVQLLLTNPLHYPIERLASSASSVPGSFTLLHLCRFAQVNTHAKTVAHDEKIAKVASFAVEEPALESLALYCAAELLARKNKDGGPLMASAVKVMASIASHHGPQQWSFGNFWTSTQVQSCLHDGIVFVALANFIAVHASPASATARTDARPLIEQALVVGLQSEGTRSLLPFMNAEDFDVLWDKVCTDKNIEKAGKLTTAHIRAFREIHALRTATAGGRDHLPKALTLALSSATLAGTADLEAAVESIALATELLEDMANYTSKQDLRQVELDSAGAISGISSIDSNLPGLDCLHAMLISQTQNGKDIFRMRLSKCPSEETLHSMPLSARAMLQASCVREESLDHALAAKMTPALCSLSFHSDLDIASSSSETLSLLLHSLPAKAIDQRQQAYQSFLNSIPQTPAAAFRLGAISLVNALLQSSAPSDASTKTLLARITQTLLDRGLAWLVRRFAEDDVDDEVVVETVDAFAALVYRATEQFHSSTSEATVRLTPHLADPVIQAGLKRRIDQRRQMEFILVLVSCTSLGATSAVTHTSALISHSLFNPLVSLSSNADGTIVESVGRGILLSIYHAMARQHPEHVLTPQHLQVLISVYGASLSASDRLLFDLFERAEEHAQRGSFLAAARKWVGTNNTYSGSSPTNLDALLTLDSARVLQTCCTFPRGRGFGMLSAGDTASRDEGKIKSIRLHTADPLWVLTLLAAGISQGQPGKVSLTGLQWLAVVQSNAIGVAVCALSSLVGSVRRTALAAIAGCYAGIAAADMQEKEHLLLVFDALRTALGHDRDSTSFAPLPLTSTLFFAHQLRLTVTPSSVLYPALSRFFLQRPVFDTTDVPALYSLLQSTDADHWRTHRLWMLRFLRDVLQGGGVSLEWRVMRRRYIWELLASMYAGVSQALQNVEKSSGKEPAAGGAGNRPAVSSVTSMTHTLFLIEEILLSAVSIPSVAVELSRKGLLTWMAQQQALQDSHDRLSSTRAEDSDPDQAPPAVSFWLALLHRMMRSSQGSWDRLDQATGGSWLSVAAEILNHAAESANDGFEQLIIVTDTVAMLCQYLPHRHKQLDHPRHPSDGFLLQRLLAVLSCVTLAIEQQRAEEEEQGKQEDVPDVGNTQSTARLVVKAVDSLVAIRRCTAIAGCPVDDDGLKRLFRRNLPLVATTAPGDCPDEETAARLAEIKMDSMRMMTAHESNGR